MKRIKRREIFFETEQFAFFSDKSKKGFLKCGICDKETTMFPPALLAEMLKISSRKIYRLIEESKIHFAENDENQMFICLETLAKNLSSERYFLQ